MPCWSREYKSVQLRGSRVNAGKCGRSYNTWPWPERPETMDEINGCGQGRRETISPDQRSPHLALRRYPLPVREVSPLSLLCVAPWLSSPQWDRAPSDPPLPTPRLVPAPLRIHDPKYGPRRTQVHPLGGCMGPKRTASHV
jgi:hypothetical protein